MRLNLQITNYKNTTDDIGSNKRHKIVPIEKTIKSSKAIKYNIKQNVDALEKTRLH
jgi:hypothetical protein